MAKRYLTAAEMRLCVDRVLPLEHRIGAAQRAVALNPHNDPLPALRKARLPGVTFQPLKIALITGKRWQPEGQVLRIRFLDGSKIQRARTKQFAEEWLPHVSVRFDWDAGASAELRISFEADPGSWSAVGTDCLHTEYFRKTEPTINFGWLRDDTDEVEWRRVVVHELGHALGAIHEHQNPRGGMVWNEEAVYAAFSGPPNNWSREDIQHNILEKYAIDQLNATKFDSRSIMLYPFPKELIKAPKSLARTGTRSNTDLSAQDKRFIAKMYPPS